MLKSNFSHHIDVKEGDGKKTFVLQQKEPFVRLMTETKIRKKTLSAFPAVTDVHFAAHT